MIQEAKWEEEKLDSEFDTELMIHRPEIWASKQQGIRDPEAPEAPVVRSEAVIEPTSSDELKAMFEVWEEDMDEEIADP